MTTLSIPIPPQLEEFVNEQVKSGRDANKAAVVRRALARLREEEAVTEILKSEQDIKEKRIFKGDLRKIIRRIK